MSTTVLPSSALSLAELTDRVRSLVAQPSLWRPKLQFGTETRWWTRLHADSSTDIWLLTWLTDQSTELHDHGESSAAFAVVLGELEELRVDPGGALSRAGVSAGTTRWVAPGVVHDVRNVGPQPAASIHAYSPPLTTMTYYRRTRRGLRASRRVVSDQPEGS